MAVSKFTIGQRVRVTHLQVWNGVPVSQELWGQLIGCRTGTVVRPESYDTIAVKMDGGKLGVLQFLPDELAPLTE